MFYIVKKIQFFLEKLRSNKIILMIAIGVVSFMAISIFMYIILTMSNGVKKDVYVKLSKDYKNEVTWFLDFKKQRFLDIVNALSANKEIINALQNNNQKVLNQYSVVFNQQLYKKDNYQTTFISFYPALNPQAEYRRTIKNALRSKNQIFGIEVQQDGVFITLIKPIIVNGNFLGLIEAKESIHSLKQDFLDKDANFVFLLNKKMLTKLSLRVKSGRYKDVIDAYTVYQSAYSQAFYSSITDMGLTQFNQALDNGYDTDNVYYKSFIKVADINSAPVGLFVVGESVDKNNGFVNMADRLVKSITYVSLGLVVAILLFMF